MSASQLSGNATEDYDTDITDITVTCTSAEYMDSTGGGSLTAGSGVTLTATNDVESLSISDDGSITEGAEDGEAITVTLSGGQFADTITASNWTVTGLPVGVSKGTVTRTDDTHVSITLSGNATADYDTDITDITVTCTSAEYVDSTGGGSLTVGSGVTLTATNDAESISISDDGSITEGAEDGEAITATLSGGTFADTITPANWTVTGLPLGVSKGTVTRTDDTHVSITLSGNATADYDIDITDITVTCTSAEYIDSTGDGNLSANSGVTLTAVNDAEILSLSSDGFIGEAQKTARFLQSRSRTVNLQVRSRLRTGRLRACPAASPKGR